MYENRKFNLYASFFHNYTLCKIMILKTVDYWDIFKILSMLKIM